MTLHSLTCAICAQTAITLPMDEKSLSTGEIWDTYEKQLQPRGWAVRKLITTAGRRAAICPNCIKRQTEPLDLPKFTGKSGCPKCRGRDVKLTYCTGHLVRCSDPLIGQEHIHRDCGDCGYSWIEATADMKGSNGKASRNHGAIDGMGQSARLGSEDVEGGIGSSADRLEPLANEGDGTRGGGEDSGGL